MTKRKQEIEIGDHVIFTSGNYVGLTGVITDINWDSKDPRAIFGFLHTVELSNGQIGFIEKSEHWQFS